jgi:hypothetical protein
MSGSSLEPYAHRLNSDGSWDSICTHCFLTIATRPAEIDLEPEEKTHDCKVYVLRRDMREERSPSVRRRNDSARTSL